MTKIICRGCVAAAILVLLTVFPELGNAAGEAAVVVNRVRFLAGPGHEQDMVGGKIAVSNVSSFEGFHVVGEIKTAPPPGQWGELVLDNRAPYRFARYEAPPGSHSGIARLEFYAGPTLLKGAGFGSIGGGKEAWKKVFNPQNTSAWVTLEPDGQFVGLDFQDAATGRRPALVPAPGVFDGPVDVSLKNRLPGAVMRYTTDGTMPSETNGVLYSQPIKLTATTSLEAVTFQNGLAPSVPVFGVYLLGPAAAPELRTFSVGNSLTGSTHDFALYAATANRHVIYSSFLRGGATTKQVWDDAMGPRKPEWDKLYAALAHVDDFTLQPRDFNLAQEADYDLRFLELIRKNSPAVHPWLYAEWVEQDRQRPTDLGKEPTAEMSRVWPAETWEESMAAMVLYVEDLQARIAQMDPSRPPPRIIPSALAMGWIHRMIDKGEMPGMTPGSFYRNLFEDNVHPKAEGRYLDDLTWFSAFYGAAPEGVLPLGTELTLPQAASMRRLAWETVKNYPGSGLYEEGKDPVAPPGFSPGTAQGDAIPMELTSATPGAWFRYTLDGTTPTRTRGYVYCGIISLRPGMRLQAIAYKSGMADSSTAEYKTPGPGL